MIKIYPILFTVILVFLFSCGPDNDAEIEILQEKLREKTSEIDELNQALEAEGLFARGKLLHLVYFNLKNDLEREMYDQFLNEVNRLKSITVVKNLVYGEHEDVGDIRSMKDFEIVMQLTFDDVSSLDEYQKDPIHLDVKDKVGPYLEGPPVVYDFIID